ncbi:hypothetical protein BDA99DRAFT_553893 [Phascolomyces articulosus]|uniref:Chitin-binding type-2 domain-containing protein n=1 Tax=Phascolomyces articulosus TaxID=60185 RepID=A0AAD5PKA9_9FUNG|nr:hypothetical protein BDA99DRAFT_553893 [Phascolomyces articulosus]
MHRFNLVFIIAFATLTITTFGVNKSSFVVLAINGPIQQNQQDNDSGNSNSSSSYTLRSRMGDENSNRLNAREESLDENLCNKLYLTDNIPSGKKYPVTCSVYYQCSRNSKGISSAPYDTLWYKCASGNKNNSHVDEIPGYSSTSTTYNYDYGLSEHMPINDDPGTLSKKHFLYKRCTTSKNSNDSDDDSDYDDYDNNYDDDDNYYDDDYDNMSHSNGSKESALCTQKQERGKILSYGKASDSCTVYYHCMQCSDQGEGARYRPIWFKCNEGFQFNEKNGKCSPEWVVQCKDDKATSTEEEDSSKSSANNTLNSLLSYHYFLIPTFLVIICASS